MKTLLNFLSFWVRGQVKIFSFLDIKDSLLKKYLTRLPTLSKKDIGIYINGTYIIFHHDEGLSICNKYVVISSGLGLLDHREGYCQSIEFIQPYTDSDEGLQPATIKENYFSLSK